MKRDTIIIGCCSTLIAASSVLLYFDFNQKVSGSNAESIGKMAYLQKKTERKYAEQVIWETLDQNSELYPDDTIRTAEGSSSMIALNDGAKIGLDENTLIMLNVKDKAPQIDFKQGNISASDVSGKGAPVTIKSGDSSIILTEGDASINKKAGSSDLSVSVSKGSAEIKDKKGTHKVSSDQTATIGADGVSVKETAVSLKKPAMGKYLVFFEPQDDVKFTWKTKSTDECTLEVSDSAKFGSIVASNKTKDSSASLRLKPGKYFWRVSVEKTKDVSAVHAFTIIQDKPLKQKSPKPDSELTFALKKPPVAFSWSKSTIATGYLLEIAKDESFKTIISSVPAATTSVNIDTIDEGTYYWRVTGLYNFDETNVKKRSDIRRFSLKKSDEINPPSLKAPADKAIISLLFVEKNPIVFNWKGNTDISSYTFELATDEKFEKKIATEKCIQAMYQLDRKLVKGTYFWRVSYKDKLKNKRLHTDARSLVIEKIMPIETLSPPDEESVKLPVNGSGISFKWKDGNKWGQYILETASDENFTQNHIRKECSVEEGRVAFPLGGKYFWRVSLAGTGTDATVVSKTRVVHVAGVLPSPQNLTPVDGAEFATDKGKDLKLKWEKVEGASWYRVRLFSSKDDKKPVVDERKVTKTSFVVDDLDQFKNGILVWDVRALKYDGDKSIGRSPAVRSSVILKSDKKDTGKKEADSKDSGKKKKTKKKDADKDSKNSKKETAVETAE